MCETVLKAEGICKSYKNVAVLNGVTMNIRKGDIYGFIGKNGAGKTTLMRIIAGLTQASDGTFELFGVSSADKRISAARKKICAMVESPAIYPDMTAAENMKMQCLITGKPSRETDKLLEFVGLGGTGKKRAKNFSLGMRQRLAIAMALVSAPELMLLDEPINGLDPEGIKQVRDLLLKLNEERGVTILISSHILTELSLFATRFGFIDGGRIIKECTPDDIARATGEGCYIECDNINSARTILERMGYNASPYEVGLHVDRDIDLMAVCTEFSREGVNLTKHVRNDLDLEGYFMQLLGKAAEVKR